MKKEYFILSGLVVMVLAVVLLYQNCGDGFDVEDLTGKSLNQTSSTSTTMGNGASSTTTTTVPAGGGAPQDIAAFVLTRHGVIHQADAVSGCSDATRQGAGPVPTSVRHDPQRNTIYMNDHVGVWEFTVDALALATIKKMDKLRFAPCLIDPVAKTVSDCIKFTSDAAGCEGNRLTRMKWVGPGELYLKTHHLTSHSRTRLLFSSLGSQLDVKFEFADPFSLLSQPPFLAPRGTGRALVGGLPDGTIGQLAYLWKNGSKYFGFFAESTNQNEWFSPDIIKLVEVTDIVNGGSGYVDHGYVTGPLKKVLQSICTGSYSICNWENVNTFDQIAISEESGIVKVRDFSNPLNVQVIDSFPVHSVFSYTGLVDGIPRYNTSGAVKVGEYIYAYRAGGQSNDADIRRYPELNPAQMAKSWYDSKSGVRPCYYGQLWRHKIGETGSWQKVTDMMAAPFVIRDGFIFYFGPLWDPETLYTHHYGTRTYQTWVTNKEALWIYNIETGEQLLKAWAPKPADAKSYVYIYQNSLALFNQYNNYYAYMAYNITGRYNEYFYLIGYELTPVYGGQ
jgi:hypothetical protein